MLSVFHSLLEIFGPQDLFDVHGDRAHVLLSWRNSDITRRLNDALPLLKLIRADTFQVST